MKRGLKHTSLGEHADTLVKAAESTPMKRGLKRGPRSRRPGAPGAAESTPMKRGLKRGSKVRARRRPK